MGLSRRIEHDLRIASPPDKNVCSSPGINQNVLTGVTVDDNDCRPGWGLLQCRSVPRKEPRYRYRSERQRHIGDALEALATRGLIGGWRLVFAHPSGRKQWEIDHGASPLAWWYITDGSPQRRKTREAEQYIGGRCREHGIEWWPVPPPGGIVAAQRVRELLAKKASQGHDVLAYSAIVEHLRWAGIDVPPVGGCGT